MMVSMMMSFMGVMGLSFMPRSITKNVLRKKKVKDKIKEYVRKRRKEKEQSDERVRT